MRAGIAAWLCYGLLLGYGSAAGPALGASVTYRLPPATVGCTQPSTLHRASGLSLTPDGRDHTLAQLHCRRVGTDADWQLLERHGDIVLLRQLPFHHGETPLYFAASAVGSASGSLPAGLVRGALVAGAVVAMWPLLRSGWRRLRRRRALRLCYRMVNRHAETLRIRRRQLVQVNSYGVERVGKWRREQAEFVKTVLQPALRRACLHDVWPAIAGSVLARIERVARQPLATAGSRHDDGVYTPTMDPIAYERYCARRLRGAGWEARATTPGSDQGADVIATRDNMRLVVQCKLYRNTVGNEAVQQVAAARLHYRADFAAVVSNADYTIPARALARSNNVFLLHHDELPALAARLMRLRKGVSMS
ncbi:restriction endonuclease [Komagataeibacter sp. FNDCR2]|uniref:restriction endonuclease n=1 Tax=Komagataeibacter sp. FNDCR2 TaxID=2878682 RepID=UPI001E47C25A|nr:restriction endonuclease [Komagataeibacter sp. FNDCR2]MCE2575557.1 restriction endonuclease [Komagataeibacter sp. FNDCR2]